jgi:hypothetical protein
MQSRESGYADETPFYRQRSWVVSAVFLAVALVCAVLSYALGGGAGAGSGDRSAVRGGDAGPRAAAADDSAGGRGSGGRPAGCRTDDSDQSRPVTAPTDVTWKRVGSAKVPVSRSAGPMFSTGAAWWCFAHTPMGAAMAAQVIPAHLGTADWRTVAQLQILPGHNRDDYEVIRSTIPQSDLDSEVSGSYQGFALASYSPKAATVRVLIRGADGTDGTASVSLAWSGGDWKLVAGSDGSLHSDLTSVLGSGTAGFVTWGV